MQNFDNLPFVTEIKAKLGPEKFDEIYRNILDIQVNDPDKFAKVVAAIQNPGEESSSLLSGFKSLFTKATGAVRDSFDPGPVPESMAMEGSYRNPLETAIGGRTNPFITAGLTALSAGQAMQGQPLTAVDLLKAGVAREGQIADLHAKRATLYQQQQTLRLQKDKEQREANIQHVKDYEGYLNKLEDLSSSGASPDSPEFVELYNQGKKAYIKQGGDAEGWASTFRAARANTKGQRDVLEVVMRSPLARLLPPSALKEAVAAIMKDPKSLETADISTMLKMNSIASANGTKPIFSDEDILQAQSIKRGLTSEESKEQVAKTRSAETEAGVKEATRPSVIAKAHDEARGASESVRKTQEDIKHVIAQTKKITQEVAAHVADPEVGKVLKSAIEKMNNGVKMSKLPEIERAAIIKAYKDPDLADQLARLRIDQVMIHGSATQAHIMQTIYAIMTQSGGNLDKNQAAIVKGLMDMARMKGTLGKSWLENFLDVEPTEIDISPEKPAPLTKPPIKGSAGSDAEKTLKALEEKFKKNKE